jgi:putrescine transport system permease protein
MTKPFLNLKSFLFIGYCFLYAPLIFMMVYSFNRSRYVTVWQGLSLKWYQSLFENKVFMKAALVSFEVAFFSATIAVVLGTMAALLFVRFPTIRGRGFLSFLCTSPMILPEVVLGMAFLMGYLVLQDWVGLPRDRGVLTIVIAHATIGLSYVFLMLRGRLKEFDSSLIEAAMDLGAAPLTIFFQITIPIILPTLISSWLLVFILSFDDLVVASFVSGSEVTTLPMAIFSSIKFGLTPEVNALATVIILFLSLILAGVAFYLSRTNKEALGLKNP